MRRALDAGVAAFRRWGIKPPPGSWIQEAASALDLAVARNSLGNTDAELKRLSAAIAMAVDLHHIGSCLGDESSRLVAAELAKITHGRLPGSADSPAGRDYMAQYWVGALLAQSKLNPRVIGYEIEGRSKPDFIVVKGGVRFAVEVKRPRTPRSARRAVSEAAGQLRTFDGSGIIIIDATDCMSVDPWAVSRSPATTREQVRADIGKLHEELYDLARSYRRSAKFSQLSMLMTFARYWNWAVDESGAARRDAGLLFHAAGLPYLWSRQMGVVTREIQKALLAGIKQLTGNPPKYNEY